MLRFDVETISKATPQISKRVAMQLRFDVETISKATGEHKIETIYCCGLM